MSVLETQPLTFTTRGTRAPSHTNGCLIFPVYDILGEQIILHRRSIFCDRYKKYVGILTYPE